MWERKRTRSPSDGAVPCVCKQELRRGVRLGPRTHRDGCASPRPHVWGKVFPSHMKTW